MTREEGFTIQPRKLLLPFTGGIEVSALTYAVQLAKTYRATLVPVALFRFPQGRQPIRMDATLAANDFLEIVRLKGQSYGVTVERCECIAEAVGQSIETLLHQRECDGIVLVVRGLQGVLLINEEIEEVLKTVPSTFFVIHLPVKKSAQMFALLFQRFFHRRNTDQNATRELIAPTTDLAFEYFERSASFRS